jgi:hypothetical protein
MRALLLALAAVVLALAAAPASAAPRLTEIGSFDLPVHVAGPPGDAKRVFVVEKAGRIMVVRNGQKLATPFLDISADVRSGGEQGLLSMAFAPDYATSRKVYVYYTARRPGDGTGSVITVQELTTAAGNPNVADPASRRTLLEIEHPINGNHNGGQLQIGPDGELYAGTGDGGSGNDPPNNAQTPSSLLGKLLRIDTVGGGARVHASGLRNPWRFSFDRVTGDLIIADVGQNHSEEVNFTPAGTGAGLNYGWRCFEGFRRTSNACTTPTAGMTPPVLEKVQSETGYCAIVGGYVVRDPDLESLRGRYLYGDNCDSGIRSAELVAPPERVGDDSGTGLRVSGLTSFGEDACGQVYAASGLGPVYRIDDSSLTACRGAGPVVLVLGRSRQRLVRRRAVRVRLACGQPCRAVVRAKLRVRGSERRFALKTVARDLAANRRTRLGLRLPRQARRAARAALRDGRRVVVGLKVTARNADGIPTVKRKTVRARR